MTDNDLALIIEPTWQLSNKTAPNSENYKPLITHFKELLLEQLRRAKDTK